MTKISVEFCIISARGLGRRSTLLNPQWFSVAWIDPNSKYCTKIDASGNSDVNWGTKFSLSVDEHDMSMQQMELTVEVYRREPVFLREHLQGTAVIQMKEYFDKFSQGKDPSGVTEETSSFQLRRKKSDKPHGFVDISIRICKEENNRATFSGKEIFLSFLYIKKTL
jgi:Rieske Fe-S protein